MKKDTKEEPPSGSDSGRRIESEGGQKENGDSHRSKLMRYAKAKRLALAMVIYLRSLAMGMDERHLAARMAAKMVGCADYLVFRDYYTVQEMRLHAGHFCQVHLLCPFCAIRRGAKMTAAYMPKFEQLLREHPTWSAYLVTFTVKNGPDLLERWELLRKAHRTLQDRRRDFLSKGWGNSVWNIVEAAVGAFEVTHRYDEEGVSKGWHPHIHMVVLTNRPFDLVEENNKVLCPALIEEWREITGGDSFIVDVRPFNVDQTPEKSFSEVFKYALKFSEMEKPDQWHAYKLLNGRRLIFSYGAFRGVKVDDSLTDDESGLEDLPFVELYYKFIQEVGYNLEKYKKVSESESSENVQWSYPEIT